jgi:hypothetical protein
MPKKMEATKILTVLKRLDADHGSPHQQSALLKMLETVRARPA